MHDTRALGSCTAKLAKVELATHDQHVVALPASYGHRADRSRTVLFQVPGSKESETAQTTLGPLGSLVHGFRAGAPSQGCSRKAQGTPIADPFASFGCKRLNYDRRIPTDQLSYSSRKACCWQQAPREQRCCDVANSRVRSAAKTWVDASTIRWRAACPNSAASSASPSRAWHAGSRQRTRPSWSRQPGR